MSVRRHSFKLSGAGQTFVAASANNSRTSGSWPASPAQIRASEKVRHAYMGTAADTDLPVMEVLE